MGHPDVDAMHLRKACERSDLIHVETEEGGDWSALLKGVDEKIVDVYSPAVTYMPEFWGRLAQLFDQLKEALPGGRNSCGKELVALRLPFLTEFSLGKMVAISQKKLLGYHNGTLVPCRLSRDMMKEQCALRQRLCGTNVSHFPSTAPLASLESVCTGLRTLLDASSGSLPLSNVKRLLRSRFRLELSGTLLLDPFGVHCPPFSRCGSPRDSMMNLAQLLNTLQMGSTGLIQVLKEERCYHPVCRIRREFVL